MNPRARAKRGKGVRPRRTGGGGGLRLLTDVLHRWRCRRPTDSALVNQCRNTQLHDPRTAHLARASHAPSSPAIELCTPGAAPAHRPQMPPATSETNFAIEIDPPDGDAHSLDDAEAEAGITSSRCHLMHNFEEERPASLVASIQESAKSSARKAKHYLSYVLDPLKKVLSSMKLLILIAIYSLLGAYLFMWLEVPNDLATKEEKYHKRKIAREVMVLNLRAIYFENRDDREERWKSAILSFEEGLELSEPVIETDWSFWMAFLYAGTIYTTIGYGNIACKTRGGQIATMLYAFIGIPIMLVMLTSLNNFLLKWMRIIANTLSDLILYTGVKLGLTKLQEGSKQRARYLAFCRKLNRSGLVATTSLTTVATSEGKKSVVDVEAATAEDEDEEDPAPDPPLFSALFTTVGWIMLSAAVFCLFEDWTFFTSFYFCFISLSTIGLGDVTPANPEYMIATFGVVIVGLSMLTVCIDVVKEKLALMYMALLEKLLKDYMDAVQSGDPNATSGLMAGFQGKAMFLMPLISKDQGAKVMTRFKEDCEKKGIAPPPVLTNIDPETGMPAFATASKDDFKDYIEVAEEKTKRNPTPEPKPVMVTKTTLTDSAPKQIPKPQMTVGITQTSTPSETIDLYSFSVQFNSSPPNAQFSMQTDIVEYSDSGFQTDSSESSDEGIQTDIAESSDEGIQTWIPGSDICVQFDTPQVPDLPKDTADSATQITLVEKNSTGVQPEVSSIYFADEDETESYLSEESEESDDYDEGLDDVEEEMPDVEKVDAPLGPRGAEIEQLVGQMPQSPPIEIIAATDTEQPSTAEEQPTATDTENRLSARNLKMQKSVSVESQETIIHVPQGDESKKKKLTAAEREKRKEEKERKQKERETRRETRRQARGLRFMKNSGDQTTPSDANDVGVQYEQFSIESSSQYDRIETRGRRSQTKLSGINQAQLGVVKESVRRKRRQRRDQLQQQHERRQHDDGEVSESGADSEREFDQQRRFERTQSSSQADIGADPSMASNSNSDVEEISLNLSVVSLAVDEHGNPVNAEDNSSDIESAEEELELLWIDGYTQTEQKTWRDQQDEVTPTALNIVVHSLTQTSISTFHRREAKTETEASSSTVEATQVDAPNTTDSKTQDKVSFMRESGAQTLQTSFYAEPSEPKESVEVAVGADEDVEGEMVNLLFLVDETTQTSFVDEKATITVDAEQSTAMSTGIQTIGREADTQTEWKGEVMRGTQTASDVRDEVVQTDEKHGKEIEIQTTKLRQRHKLCQTHVKEQAERDSQTEVVHNIQETGVQALMTDVNDTAVDATTDLRTQQVQSDVSMFVVDQMDRSKLEVVHDVRFNVDSSTQADLVNSIDSSTQSESLEMDSVEVQVTPSMTTSHTQHTHICSSDHTSQTEANMRSRYSQGVSAVQETIESSASSVSEMRSTPMQVETQRVDQGVQPEAPTATECGVDPIFELVSRASQYELHTNERASEARVDTTDVGFNVYIDVASEVETKETGTQNSTDLVDKSCDSLAIEQKTQWAQCESVTENKGTDTALLVLVEEVAIQNSDDVAEIALSPIRIEYQDSSTSPPPGSDAHNQFVQAAYDVVETGSDAFYLGVSVAVQEIVDVLDEASGVLYFGTAEVAVQSSADTVDHSTTCDEKVETCDTASDAVIILPDTSSIASQTQVDSKETTCATDPTPTEDRSCDVIIIPGVDAGLQAVVESQEKSSGEQLLTASRSVDIPDEAELDIGILSSAGKLWGDFDYIYEAVSPETSQDVQTSLVVITADNAAQAQPEVAESKTQTLRFKKKKEKVADKMDVTKIEKADQNVEARVETAEGVVQAVADTAEQSAGFDGDDDDWLQVYVQELDQERRLRMLDIGIQTGVLARVQHMYTRRPSMSDEPSSSAAPITLRKSSESSEQLTMRHARGSEESLARTTSAMSMADSTDDRSPFQSRDSSRQSSLKRPTRARDIERAIERSQVVTDLRARFETRSSTSPRDSREALRKEPPPPPLERKDSSE